jgi:UTP--glucose-1-phosphate uridylyltransferase
MSIHKPIKKAVIPVAGLGTRMLPATKAIPKELLPVFDRPIIEHVVREAIIGGITEIIFVTRSGKEAIENHFDAHYELEHRLVNKGKEKVLESIASIVPDHVKITSVRQNDALGLGHAVLCAKHVLNDEPFAVMLPDVLVLDREKREQNFSFNQLVQSWNETGIGQIMVERVDFKNVESYGIVELEKETSIPFMSNPIRGLIEKPSSNEAPSNLAVLGRYILPSNVLKFLSATKPGLGDEIQLTDALGLLLTSDGLNAYETDADIYDCGSKVGLLSANLAFGMRDPEIRSKLLSVFQKINS